MLLTKSYLFVSVHLFHVWSELHHEVGQRVNAIGWKSP